MTTDTDGVELVRMTVAQAAAALRARTTSPTELTEAYLARIETTNPSVNAYVNVTAERAREDASRAQEELARGLDRGPLHGIPVALKDLIDTEGIPTAGGADVYRDRVPGRDATVAARLRESGAVLLGKTNTHELAFGVTTDNPHFGATRNPWDPTRIPGGSSGGSGAAIAARMAAATIGTDTGGSIRVPSALCGCVGLKPTYGLVPKDGVMVMSHLVDHVGPITRSVEDAALVLQVIAGYAPHDPASLMTRVPDYRSGLAGGVAGLRIGVPRSTMWGLLDAEVAAAAEDALLVVRDLGAAIVEVDLPDQFAAIGMPGSLGLFSVVVEESRFNHRDAWRRFPERFGADLAAIYSSPELTGPMVAESLELVAAYAAAVRVALSEVDLLVSPTVPVPAPVIGTETVEVAGMELALIAVAIANVAPFNMARVPAISVPCGFTTGGLPIGLQFVGPPLGEPVVLRAAHAYEQATTWHDMPSPV